MCTCVHSPLWLQWVQYPCLTMIFLVGLCLLIFLLYKRYMVQTNYSNPSMWLRYLKDKFKKWSHLPGVKPHWFWGNRPIFSTTFKDIFLSHYEAMKGHRSHILSYTAMFTILFVLRFGVFWHGNEPCIFLRDLDLIKKVQITDYDHFIDFGNEDKWKNFLTVKFLIPKASSLPLFRTEASTTSAWRTWGGRSGGRPRGWWHPHSVPPDSRRLCLQWTTALWK